MLTVVFSCPRYTEVMSVPTDWRWILPFTFLHIWKMADMIETDLIKSRMALIFRILQCLIWMCQISWFYHDSHLIPSQGATNEDLGVSFETNLATHSQVAGVLRRHGNHTSTGPTRWRTVTVWAMHFNSHSNNFKHVHIHSSMIKQIFVVTKKQKLTL